MRADSDRVVERQNASSRSIMRRLRFRPGSLPAFALFGLAAVPCPPRHFELEPRFLGLDGLGAVLDPRTALFGLFFPCVPT
jgi:hypothetical protein